MWITEIENRIDCLIKKLTEVEIKRLQLDYLLTVAQRLNLESEKCDRCDYLKADIEEALMIIEKAEDIKESQRRAYNTRIKGIISHLRKEHGLKSKNYYATQYSNLGLIGGVLAGIWFMDQIVIMLGIVLMGPLIGKMIGSVRDKKNNEDLI
jgi:hypothetical protein